MTAARSLSSPNKPPASLNKSLYHLMHVTTICRHVPISRQILVVKKVAADLRRFLTFVIHDTFS